LTIRCAAFDVLVPHISFRKNGSIGSGFRTTSEVELPHRSQGVSVQGYLDLGGAHDAARHESPAEEDRGPADEVDAFQRHLHVTARLD
jgi:hypothetical protein